MGHITFWNFLCSAFFIICLPTGLLAQCPGFSDSNADDHTTPKCEGDQITLSATGIDLPIGSQVDWYMTLVGSQDPYGGVPIFIGQSNVVGDPCANLPEVLYVMVNPDNGQVGGSGDQCDEFIVMWTGSGGYLTSDINITNLGPGSFVWDGFIAGNAANFSCGTALAPGPVPENAILIIQSSPNNNVFIDSDVLCASGLPVFIIAYDGTAACTGGYFDNNSPCSSCPVMIDINGTCDYQLELDYMPPGGSLDGWGWSNLGTGIFADEIPPLEFPEFESDFTVEDFVWTIPDNYCELYDTDNNFLVGIPDPPPPAGCPQVTTSFFGFDVICPTLSFSGGLICEGNCPDAPNEIEFFITDGPLELDLVVSASLFPPFNINDIVVNDGEKIFVCLGGFVPSFDQTTNTLTIPSLAVGLTATVTINSAVSAAGCSVNLDPNFITLQFVEAPQVNAGSDQTICSHDQVIMDGTYGGSTVETTWTTSGDGVFADPSDPVTTYTPGSDDIQDGEVTLTLTGVDEDGACLPASSSMELTIISSTAIDPGPAQTICNTDIATLIANFTGPDIEGFWETTGDGAFDDPADPVTFYQPGSDDILNGSVTVTYVPVDPDDCVVSNESLIIDILPAPDVSVPADVELCNDEILTLMINVTGNFTNITWTTAGDGQLNVINNMEVTYTPGPQDILDQFTIISVNVVSGFAVCGQTTYNIPVNIIDCDCPPLVTIPPSEVFCLDNDTLDLSTMLSAGGLGQWNITAAPPVINPPVIIGNELIANWSDWGIYTLTYTLDNPEPGCPFQSSETLELTAVAQPFLGPDMQICVGAQVILSGNFVYFIPDLALIDLQTSGDGVFQNNTGLTVEYVYGPQDSVSPQVTLVYNVLDYGCGVLSDTIEITNILPPVVNFVNDTVAICNETDKGSVINFPALIAAGDLTGTWTNSGGAPVDFSDPSAVDFDGVAEGFYTFNYETNSATAPCQDQIFTITIEVKTCLCPLLEVQNVPEGLCNDLASINLNAFIMAGAPGTWSILNAPPGGNPATLSGPVFDILNSNPGLYQLRFTFDSAPLDGCPDSADIEIMLQEPPYVGLPPFLDSCGLKDIVISSGFSGSATGILWSTSGSGTFDDVSIINPVYTPSLNDLNATTVFLIATTIDTFGFCPADVDSIRLNLIHPPSTSWSSLEEVVCNHPDSQTVVNLMSYIIGGDGTGIWSNTDNAPVDMSDPTSIDFENVTPGTYHFTYLTQTAVSPCVDSSYIFTVTVEDCIFCTLSTEDISDTIFLCEGDTFVLIPIVTGAVGLPFSTWISDVTLMQPTLPLFEEKTWIWIVKDFAGCEVRDTFHVAFLEDLQIETEVIDPSCNGLSDGAIIIHGISGGTGPFTINLDNLPPFTSNTPDTINDVAAGLHTLEINTVDGCGPLIQLNVMDAALGAIDLGPDVFVASGDSVFIETEVTDINVMDVSWDPNVHTNDLNSFWFTPEITTNLLVVVTDSLGCIYQDEKLITVTKEHNLYVPNIFSPNGDQVNDELIISSSFDPSSILSLEIFDRWGNMIYRQQGNDPYSWDGISKGKEAMTGVYVVKVSWMDEQGNPFLYFSDVTLIR